jgi:hypothetical protein
MDFRVLFEPFSRIYSTESKHKMADDPNSQTLSLWSECNSFAYGPDSEYNRFSFQPSDSNPTYCDTQLLARALQSLHNVKYLHIESGEYPFVKRNLLQHWDQMHKLNRTVSGALSTFQNLKPATKYYRSILMAVNATTLSLTTLRLNCMPSECFVNPGKEHANSPPNYLSAMSAAVSKVHDAQICFSGWAMDRYTPTENETIVRNIVSFLSSMPLRTLDCQWDWNCGRMIWHAFLFRTVFALHLPFLESLQLQTLPLQYYTVTPGGQLPTTLAVFLSRHASTLRRVYFDSTMLLTQGLYHCLEARCAWKGNLDIIKATMKLEKFEFIIDQGDGERIYNPDWTPISGGKECDAKDLENYVLGKDVWKPMWGHDDTKCPLQGGPDWTQGL